MYHPTTRVLAVLALLQSHQRLTGAQMAKRLEVNIRTLRRYVTMLQDLGIPIVAERGRAGSYELVPGYKLPPMMFTNDEALALAIGLLTARHLGIAETLQAIESAQAKLEQVMPLDLKQQVHALTESVTLDLNVLPMEAQGKVLLAMSSAALLRRRVHMHYRSRAEDETERDFDPYSIAFRHGCWYVIGYCGLRRDLRSFRLDRVVQVDLTDTPFERPADFDPLVHLSQSVATLPRAFSFEVLLHTDLVTAQQALFNVQSVLEPHPDGVLMRGTADDLDWLARVLAGFSFEFTVITPDALRDAVRSHAETLLQRMGQG
jgi:predicted DNA-binding transcriptional regulator YafY